MRGNDPFFSWKWWKTSCDEVKEKQIVSVRLHSKLTYEEVKEEQIVCVRQHSKFTHKIESRRERHWLVLHKDPLLVKAG